MKDSPNAACTGPLMEAIQAFIDKCANLEVPLKPRAYTRKGYVETISKEDCYSLKTAWVEGISREDTPTLGPTLCIGAITLEPRLRNRGIFREFLTKLDTLQGIDAVVFEYVFEQRLRDYFERKGFAPLALKDPLDIFFYRKINNATLPNPRNQAHPLA